MSNQRFVIDLMNQSGAFEHVFRAHGFVYVANRLDHLTGFCSPKIRRRQGTCHIEYDLLITVIDEKSSPETFFSNVANRKYLGLPRTIPSKNTFDTFVENNKISEWLMDTMIFDMQNYTLPYGEAVSLINSKRERFLENLQSVFKQRVQEVISGPLENLR